MFPAPRVPPPSCTRPTISFSSPRCSRREETCPAHGSDHLPAHGSDHLMVETIQWTSGGVVMIDQTRLPREEIYVTCTTYEEVAEAILSMVIRGAPAIGVAAAMGIALGVAQANGNDLDGQFEKVCDTLARTRPTAVNLFWAIDRMKRIFAESRGLPLSQLRQRLIAEAQQIR